MHSRLGGNRTRIGRSPLVFLHIDNKETGVSYQKVGINKYVTDDEKGFIRNIGFQAGRIIDGEVYSVKDSRGNYYELGKEEFDLCHISISTASCPHLRNSVAYRRRHLLCSAIFEQPDGKS